MATVGTVICYKVMMAYAVINWVVPRNFSVPMDIGTVFYF